MKGLELSKAFFENAGRPIIEKISPSIMNSIAAGLIGEGSDVYGFDDELSTDHNWGPRFQIFLFEQNPILKESIETALASSLQSKFDGYEIRQWPPEKGFKSFEVWFWPDFTEKLLGLRQRPVDPMSYARVTEAQFFSLLSGSVFWDPNGDLKRARTQWDHMPQEVWYWRLYWAWMNLYRRDDILRAFIHGEFEMSRILLCRYAEWTIRLGYLASRQYSPYRKWLLRMFKTLSGMERIHDSISNAINTQDVPTGFERLEHAIALLKEMMVEKRYLPSGIGDTTHENNLVQKPVKSDMDANLEIEKDFSADKLNEVNTELEHAKWLFRHCKSLIKEIRYATVTDALLDVDVYPIAGYFLSLIGSDFRDQAARQCPLDLVGLLEQRPGNAP